MSVTTLARSLLTKPGFQTRLDKLTIESVLRQFQGVSAATPAEVVQHDWYYMIMCASLLSLSRDGDCEDAALRIAHHCLLSDHSPTFRDAVCVIFDTLTNRPAIDLAQRRGLVAENSVSRLPLMLRLDWMNREIQQTVFTGPDGELNLNRFQRQMWDLANASDYLSVSAATSTGKSYAFCHWLSNFILATKADFIIYLVPTRALIYQVETDLREHFAKELPFPVNVSSFPMATAFKPNRPNVFVLTQERLHILLMVVPADRHPNLLIVDEAQKVGDGARGVLLQNVIAALSSRSSEAKIFFASPMVSNPEVLLETLPFRENKQHLASPHISVNQNLIWVSQVPSKPLLWQLELCLRGNTVNLGQVTLPFRPTQTSKRLTFVAKTLGDAVGGNLIYVNGAADAEIAAHQLWDLAGPAGDCMSDAEISGLVDLVRKVIHPQYALATYLQRGVAFHYGNMPLLIRNEVERLFRSNQIKYLVCTSTLIEGVNLPCKSIFVRGPKKGKGKPMNDTDFWNLAGRAGRLGKEFQGNIICVDARDQRVWPQLPPRVRGTYPIKRASDTIFESAEEFIEYLEGDTPTEKSQDSYDHLLTYIISELNNNGSLLGSLVCKDLPAGIRERLEKAVARCVDTVNIPRSIIERNPGISPFAMNRLRAYLARRADPLEELIPVPPESQNTVEVYRYIFDIINDHLAPIFGKRSLGLAILVVQWMRGYPLSRIIQAKIRNSAQRKANTKLSSMIRGVMEDVETYARFLVPKYLGCYTDIFTLHLNDVHRQDLVLTIPNVNMWLEFGASQQTQLNMMGLGLSRTTAVALSEYIADDNLPEEAVIERLRQLNLDGMNLPQAFITEVKRLLLALPMLS